MSDPIFQRGLQDLVKGIRAHKKDASVFISQQIAEIKIELRSTDPFLKSEAVSFALILLIACLTFNIILSVQHPQNFLFRCENWPTFKCWVTMSVGLHLRLLKLCRSQDLRTNVWDIWPPTRLEIMCTQTTWSWIWYGIVVPVVHRIYRCNITHDKLVQKRIRIQHHESIWNWIGYQLPRKYCK